MKKYLYIFISAILSGFCIAIGACVYLSLISTHKVVGSFLFGLGLFAIIHFNLYLYTGKVGNLLGQPPKYLLDLLICLLGNLLGVIALTALIRLSRISDSLVLEAVKIVEMKQSDTWYSILILSILCGVMIYLAVKGHQKCEYPIGKIIFCFLSISIFILCGFEHCVANAAYYTLAGQLDFKTLWNFLLMILGNAGGAILFDGLLRITDYIRDNEKKGQ